MTHVCVFKEVLKYQQIKLLTVSNNQKYASSLIHWSMSKILRLVYKNVAGEGFTSSFLLDDVFRHRIAKNILLLIYNQRYTRLD